MGRSSGSPKKHRKKHKNTLYGYSRTESFNRISGFTAVDTSPQVARNRIIATLLALAILLIGLYFVFL